MRNLLDNLSSKNITMSLIMGILFAALACWILLISSPAYKATSEVLIINNGEGVADSYTMAKSAEYFSRLISNVIYSESFVDQVMQTSGKNSFSQYNDRLDKLKNWEKKIKVTRSIDVSIIEIEVLGNNLIESQKVSNAILNVLTEKNSLFLGKNQDIEVKVLTGSVIEKNPGLGIMMITAVLGILLGVVTYIFSVYLKETYLIKKTLKKNVFPAFSQSFNFKKEENNYSPNINFND